MTVGPDEDVTVTPEVDTVDGATVDVKPEQVEPPQTTNGTSVDGFVEAFETVTSILACDQLFKEWQQASPSASVEEFDQVSDARDRRKKAIRESRGTRATAAG
jgi:hypothetical protein